jgi:hypothetical protein
VHLYAERVCRRQAANAWLDPVMLLFVGHGRRL